MNTKDKEKLFEKYENYCYTVAGKEAVHIFGGSAHFYINKKTDSFLTFEYNNHLDFYDCACVYEPFININYNGSPYVNFSMSTFHKLDNYDYSTAVKIIDKNIKKYYILQKEIIKESINKL